MPSAPSNPASHSSNPTSPASPPRTHQQQPTTTPAARSCPTPSSATSTPSSRTSPSSPRTNKAPSPPKFCLKATMSCLSPYSANWAKASRPCASWAGSRPSYSPRAIRQARASNQVLRRGALRRSSLPMGFLRLVRWEVCTLDAIIERWGPG